MHSKVGQTTSIIKCCTNNCTKHPKQLLLFSQICSKISHLVLWTVQECSQAYVVTIDCIYKVCMSSTKYITPCLVKPLEQPTQTQKTHWLISTNQESWPMWNQDKHYPISHIQGHTHTHTGFHEALANRREMSVSVRSQQSRGGCHRETLLSWIVNAVWFTSVATPHRTPRLHTHKGKRRKRGEDIHQALKSVFV